MRLLWKLWFYATCLFALSLGHEARSNAQELSLSTELIEHGLAFDADVQIRLAAPSLHLGLSEAAKQETLHRLAGKQEWSSFTRDSLMAPIAIDIETIDDSQGERLGITVHNAFIVYAELGKLRDAEAMQEMFGRPGNSGDSAGVVTEEISKDELRRLGMTAEANSAATYAYLELPLLNKVLVRGVIRIEKREREGASEFFWRLDPAFDSVDKYASRWTKLERNSVGKLFEGESFAYSGCGGFLGVYELEPGTNQLLVESRLLLREPREWFAGSNFLRSKLPSMMQENARNFRRKLANH